MKTIKYGVYSVSAFKPDCSFPFLDCYALTPKFCLTKEEAIKERDRLFNVYLEPYSNPIFIRHAMYFHSLVIIPFHISISNKAIPKTFKLAVSRALYEDIIKGWQERFRGNKRCSPFLSTQLHLDSWGYKQE